MQVIAIATRVLAPPKDDLLAACKESALALREGDVLAVTSKVVSIWQGRCIAQSDVPDKDKLIRREADAYLERGEVPGGHVIHTLKEGVLIPTAGIDASNGDGYYILWPDDPMNAAEELRAWGQKEYGVKKLGVIVTDSRSLPLRRGTVGFALGWSGIEPLRDYRGEKDLFGEELKITQTNVVDALAAAAVFSMGEGAERTPAAVVRDAPGVWDGSGSSDTLKVPVGEDIYAPFVRSVPWQKGDGEKGPEAKN